MATRTAHEGRSSDQKRAPKRGAGSGPAGVAGGTVARVRVAEKVAVVVGIGLHLAIGAVPFAVTGLIAPLWAVVVLWILWLAMLAVAVWPVRRQRPLLVPLVPLASLAVWFAFTTFGGAVLGWTA